MLNEIQREGYSSCLECCYCKECKSEWVGGTFLEKRKAASASLFFTSSRKSAWQGFTWWNHPGDCSHWQSPRAHWSMVLTSCWLLQFANVSLRLCFQARSQHKSFVSHSSHAALDASLLCKLTAKVKSVVSVLSYTDTRKPAWIYLHNTSVSSSVNHSLGVL